MEPDGARDPEAWLARLARSLPRHAEILRRLTAGVRDDERVVHVVVSCSVGRGAADELSDLDCSLSLEPSAWPGGLELVEPLVRSAGTVVDLLHHRWPGAGSTENRRTAVQYADGVQLDLMVWPVTAWSGMHPPDTVVLYESREVFTRPWEAVRGLATIAQLREWTFLGWWMLLDADKYLRRGSPWEARQRLEEARAVVWQLTAAAQGLQFAEYGITTLLDAEAIVLPDGMGGTVAGLDAARLRAAVMRCAAVLGERWAPAAAAVGEAGAVQPPLAAWALMRLHAQGR